MSPPEGSSTNPDDSRYVIEEKVAAGGMGVVYRVLDRSLGRTVAMKVCSREEPSRAGEEPGSSARARFLEEARVTAQLDHPGIVPVHEVGARDGGQAYFTMPLVKGQGLGSVFELARGGREGWNLSRAVAALVKVCQAAAYAHSKGIVHRDLKPANVMVGRFGEVYVLDWGLAKVIGKEELPGPNGSSGAPSALATQEGDVLGTPAYMPPEQAAGRLELVNERSDVYALGAMLYALLTGHAPYLEPEAKRSSQLVLARILHGPPQAVRALSPKAPAELAAICEKAMARDPAARYATAFDLAEDLQAYLDNRVVSAYRTGAIAELSAWCARHALLLKVSALLAGGLTISILGAVWYLRVEEAAALVERARAHLVRYRELKGEAPRLHEEWLRVKTELPDWAPVWHRQEEIRLHRELERTRQELETRFNSALIELSNGLKVAPPSGIRAEALGQLRELYAERYLAMERGETVHAAQEIYRRKLEELYPGATPPALEARGRISIQSDPAGADVYCFRYVEGADTRLVPLPFDGTLGRVTGEPALRVAAILEPERHQGVFAAGDRVVEVRGRPIRSEMDLGLALEGLAAAEEVAVKLERLGSLIERKWVPFPEPAGGQPGERRSLTVVHAQLGLVFEGYPLEFVPSCRLGETPAGGPLSADLPEGSYLLVLRKLGYRDTRIPVVVPTPSGLATVRLFRDAEVPPGFVHIPAGRFSCGGDPQAFQSLDRSEVDLGDYFMGRTEVTFAEYLEYLNDPEVRKQRSPAGEDEVEEKERQPGTLLVERQPDGTWALSSRVGPGSPLCSVSQSNAVEYARWRTRKEDKWRYRLPTDEEWEKAARGADRRAHVWGEYLIRAFSWSAALPRPRLPNRLAVFSADESVYGVRDMAGSVDELTSSQLSRRWVTRRGGNWQSSDPQNLRVANRNGRLATGRGTETGFRLVAEPME